MYLILINRKMATKGWPLQMKLYICGHLTIIPIGQSFPNCCHKGGNTPRIPAYANVDFDTNYTP